MKRSSVMIALSKTVAEFVSKKQRSGIGGQLVSSDARIEVFNPSIGSPLASLTRAGTAEIDLAVQAAANAAIDAGPYTRMGLDDRSRILWSQCVVRARRMAYRLKAETIWVKCWGETDATSPFGGVNKSEYSREMGREALSLYSQTKSIWVTWPNENGVNYGY